MVRGALKIHTSMISRKKQMGINRKQYNLRNHEIRKIIKFMKSWNQEIMKSGNQDIRESGNQEIRKSGK